MFLTDRHSDESRNLVTLNFRYLSIGYWSLSRDTQVNFFCLAKRN